MNSQNSGSPPRRKLSRLKRAKSQATLPELSADPLQPADNRLNSPAEQIIAGRKVAPSLDKSSRLDASDSIDAPEQGDAINTCVGRSSDSQQQLSADNCKPSASPTGKVSAGVESGQSHSDAQEPSASNSRGPSNASQDAASGKSMPGSGREDASESGKKRDSSEANEKDGTSLIRDEQEYASEGEAEGVASEGDAGSPEGSAGRREAHWDEEDELEAFLQRNQAGKSGSNSAASDSGSEAGSEAGQAEGSQAGSGTEDSDEEGEGDMASLAGPELQRKLREQAHRECIGRAAPPAVKPLDGVLAKIRAIADAAAARAAQTKRVDLPPASAHKMQPAPQDIEDDDDIIIESDDDLAGSQREHGNAATPSVPLRLAIGSETQQDMPLFEERMLAAAGPDKRSAGQDSLARSQAIPDAKVGDAEQAVEAGSKDEGFSDEEAEASFSDASSDVSEEEGGNDEEDIDHEEARKAALAEAQAMLRDEKNESKEQYFEDEAEMSEDGGHSDEASGTEEDEGDHAKLLEDLIGHERERRGDERLRAAAHAQWLAQQDEVDVQRLMDGMKNGFRKPKRAAFLMDEDGDLADSRKRRAALNAENDDSGEETGSQESSDSESDESTDPKAQTQISGGEVSDDEARDTLQRYQQQKALEASQVDDQVEMDLLDDESQALVSKLVPEARSLAAGEQKKLAKAVLDIDEGMTLSATASFLGRAASISTAMRNNSQNNTRSYVFGRDNSNSAQIPEVEEQDGKPAKARGPTSFAGIKRTVTAASQQKNGQLLSMLEHPGKGSTSAKARTGSIDISDVLGRSMSGRTKPTRLR